MLLVYNTRYYQGGRSATG